MKLEPGDFVTCLTGGPLMCVEQIRDAKGVWLAHTIWIDREGHVLRDVFDVGALQQWKRVDHEG